MSRYRTMRLASGAVVPSGVDAHARDRSRRPLAPRAALYRAIVTRTYVTTDPESRSRFAVECDVILVNSNKPLPRVPVTQVQQGVNNVHDLWIPRPCTRVVSDATAAVSFAGLGTLGQPNVAPSLYGDLDGDHVVLGFIENDPDFPIILRAYPHARTKRLVTGDADSIGWEPGNAGTTRGTPYRNEMYTAHYGTEVRVNAKGDLLIDTVGAFDDPATEDASVDSGQIRFRVKNSQRFTVEMDGTDVLEVWKDGSQVRIDLGENAAQRLILGDDFMDWINQNIVQKVNTHWTTTFNTHTHSYVPGTLAAVQSGPPVPTEGDSIPQMTDALLSDLAKTKKT